MPRAMRRMSSSVASLPRTVLYASGVSVKTIGVTRVQIPIESITAVSSRRSDTSFGSPFRARPGIEAHPEDRVAFVPIVGGGLT